MIVGGLVVLLMVLGFIAYFTIGQQINLTAVTGDGAVAELRMPDGFRAEVFA